MLKKTMIAILLLAGLAGCKSTTPEAIMKKQCDENRAAIRATIQDSERQAAMLEVVDSFEKEIADIAVDSTDARSSYNDALRQYKTTPEQLKVFQTELESCLHRLCIAAKQHSLDLRKHCSEGEWKDITAHYHKLKNVVYF